MRRIKELLEFVNRDDTDTYYETRLNLIVEKINELIRAMNEIEKKR